MCSCSEAFHNFRACAVLIVGVAGSMPAHGIGTACFIIKVDGKEHILRIQNCLFCHGEDNFNLISVSQMLRTRTNEVIFSSDDSRLELRTEVSGSKPGLVVGLQANDGLYEMEVSPLYADDERVRNLPHWNLTLDEDPHLWTDSGKQHGLSSMKAPTRLGVWHCKVLSVTRKIGVGISETIKEEYDGHLKDFCDSYLVPPSQPSARRTFQAEKVEDMAKLSLRFMGAGQDRLVQTLKRSRGLTQASKAKGDNISVVPPLNFPQGRWRTGKTPKVVKGKVDCLHRASIAEVCFSDTFEVEDKAYRYGQVFVDYRSRFGDAIPIRSRKKVGWSFGEFCCRHYVPLILIRDNIAENTGGALMEECHRRGVKSAFSSPYKPQQDYAEGYLGRLTMMASFAMVLSGAPVFMWRWAIICAAFINNITATFYKREQIWATPWEVLHGEPFPDASIVVPFGCGALIMLTKDEREKFKATCAMVVFVHYALDHPLYTYAFFSPRTKRILFRQDCIMLPETFPMREARTRVGLIPDGEILVTYRPKDMMQKKEEGETSFGLWKEEDSLPDYQDHITGYTMASPQDETSSQTQEKPSSWPRQRPSHPSFGPPSVVEVPKPWEKPEQAFQFGGDDSDPELGEEKEKMLHDYVNATDKYERAIAMQPDDPREEEEPRIERPRRAKKAMEQPPAPATRRRRVNERWTYEPVQEESKALTINTQVEVNDEVDVKEEREENFGSCTTNCQVFVSSDQSKSIFNGESPMINFKKSQKVNFGEITGLSDVPLFDSLGPVETVPEYLEHAEDNEETAWSIQGLIFHDDEKGWCIITGWGVDHGVNIVFYAPVDARDTTTEEEHASLFEVLSWISQSPMHPRLSDYRSSRAIKKSNRVGEVRSLIMRRLTVERRHPVYGMVNKPRITGFVPNIKILSSKTIIRILKSQESLFKYGTLIPRNDREAELSPEAPRWRSGRTLEWLRLKQAKTFETDWTWERIRKEHPEYLKGDIGHMFYVYDYKYSGEHRVRLVFDGSRQSPTTYGVTYAPTVRAESVRLFHLYAVEYGWSIQQFDVPQAFLRSDADCTIFVYPPKGQSDFPGQLLKLSKMLYGSKQAAALWFNLLNSFLLKLGFQASPMDSCFYRRAYSPSDERDAPRSDAIIILHVDDMRVAARPEVLRVIHDKLFEEFQITTSDTGRFLGMDMDYNLSTGVLKMHMSTYIEATRLRFSEFDLTKGIPYRELVGSLLWIVLCVLGPELLRVKDLAKRSNKYVLEDYHEAVKVLDRIVLCKDQGILYRRGGANKEYIPSKVRLGGGLESEDALCDQHTSTLADYSIGDPAQVNELEENHLYKLDDFDDVQLDIEKHLADTNQRFTKVAYSDASFAIGETKQSISGFIVMINGVPILWGSLKQTVVVDSTCSAEYVAASICCKQIIQAENMVQFLDFTCPKPYKMYTDSQACLKIATNASKMGMVRHLEIRYHLVRCIVISGDVTLEYCITEEMLADLFTKIVTSAQDRRLSIRFYNDCVMVDK